eukprot:scaffold5243_cov124-Pinguiococcus_pyrenoidosus.AAC.1
MQLRTLDLTSLSCSRVLAPAIRNACYVLQHQQDTLTEYLLRQCSRVLGPAMRDVCFMLEHRQDTFTVYLLRTDEIRAESR